MAPKLFTGVFFSSCALFQANILISGDKVARLADFGLAEVIEDVAGELPHLTQSDSTTSNRNGNPRWMAPEMLGLESTGVLSSRRTRATDIYSFAMTMIQVTSVSFRLQCT